MELMLLNRIAYNELVLSQEDTVCFQIYEEVKTKSNKYGNTGKAWMKLSRKFEPTKVDPKTRIYNKSTKCKLYYITKNHDKWFTNIELLRGDLQNLT